MTRTSPMSRDLRALVAMSVAVIVIAATCRPNSSSLGRAVAEADLMVAPGITVHYRVFGRGADTIVVVPGGPALPARYLEQTLGPLGLNRAVVVYDGRGRGNSSEVRDSARMGLEHDVADLEALRVALGIERLALVGDNWGAVVAAAYAASHPEHAARVVMLAPSAPRVVWGYALAHAGNDPRVMAGYLAATGAHLDSLDPRGFCRRYWPFYLSPMVLDDSTAQSIGNAAICDAPPDQLRRITHAALLLSNSVGALDLRDRVRSAQVPILIVAGLANPVYAAIVREWREALPTARVDSADGTSMFPWIVDPDRTFAHVDRFLKGEWPAGVQ